MDSEKPKLTVERMMDDMREAGMFERAERRMIESQKRAAKMFGLPDQDDDALWRSLFGKSRAPR